MARIASSAGSSHSLGRRGVYFDKRAGQFVSRVGFWLNNAGQRKRALQYLGAEPEEATIKHIGLVARWNNIKANWLALRDLIRPGLPEAIRATADLALPVWIRDEWIFTAESESLNALTAKITNELGGVLADVEGGRKFLKMMMMAGSKHDWLQFVPDNVRARVHHATQPTAYEVMGFSPDAERLTVDQARTKYLDDCRARIALPEDGIKAGTFQNTQRMLRLALGITVKDENGTEQRVVDPNSLLETITRDDLIAFKRAWLAKVVAGEVAKRTAANYCKAVQFFLAWCYKRDRIVTRRVSGIEDVFRFSDINPINIADYAQAKEDLKAVLNEASPRVKLYIYLALNCGHYQVDIGRLKLAEVQQARGGARIVRRRDKTSAQNSFCANHVLWPETWMLLKAELATTDSNSNPQGLALLNEDSRPLYQGSADHAKIDNITSAYWRVVRSVNAARAAKKLPAVSLSFKQYRKIGATAMHAIAGEVAQKLYRSASFEGADRFYVRGDFSILDSALKKWRRQLKADKIL